MHSFDGLNAYFGDLHNHCGISYGHGSIEEAYANAREQLDFCSVTGHAFWPDMPEPNERIQHIVDFHVKGFAKLKRAWPHVKELTRQSTEDGKFVVFLSYEMHSKTYGDHTILYKDIDGDILYVDGLPELREALRKMKKQGHEAIAFPHHLAYRLGARGMNWDTFTPEFSPVVELISMHGCSETNENTHPFIHSMGPADWPSTMQYGLAGGHTFGVVGNTDHHSAYPGSYNHGRTGLWAKELTRDGIWEAIQARRTYALTGDRMELKFTVNNEPMGSVLTGTDKRNIEIDLTAGGAVDYVDLVKNNRLLRRWSETDVPQTEPGDTIRTKLLLELGWGQPKRIEPWEVTFGISDGRILAYEPRFRGQEVVSPLEKEKGSSTNYHDSHWKKSDDRSVAITTTTNGNPTKSTNASQGFCLEVEMPLNGKVIGIFNGKKIEVPLSRLLEGAKSGNLADIDSPAYRFHRAPLPWEYNWNLTMEDAPGSTDGRDVYYVRVRQKNDQWAWSSPIFIE